MKINTKQNNKEIQLQQLMSKALNKYKHWKDKIGRNKKTILNSNTTWGTLAKKERWKITKKQCSENRNRRKINYKRSKSSHFYFSARER